jgi:starvation-inducible DNA-binding protein
MSDAILKNEPTDLAPEIGLKDRTRESVAEELGNAIADSYRLMINTQGLHWNVQGPLFYSLHKLTEEQYEDLFEAIDDLAERIRALGLPAPYSFTRMYERSEVPDIPGDDDLETQVQCLIDGNEKIAYRLRGCVKLAEDLSDVKTADMLTDRIGIHETNAWMLRATIAA